MNFIKKIKNYYKRAYQMGHFPSTIQILFSKKKKVFYCGFLGDGNYGDELVYQAAIKLHSSLILIPIKRHMPLILRLGVRIFSQSISGVVIGGGTLIRGDIEENLFVLKLIKKGKPVFLHGTGVSEKIAALNFWNEILGLKPIGGVRGPLSVKNINNNFNLEFPVIGDAAFSLYDSKYLNEKSLSSKQILINLGTHVFNSNLVASRTEIELFINTYIQKGFKVCYLPLHTIDEKLGFDLKNKYPDVKMLKIPENYKEAISHFEKSTFAIGERLHFNVLSLLGGCPFLSINYDKKHEDFLMSCDVSFAGIAINEVSLKTIVSFYENKDLLFNWKAINLSLNNLKIKQDIAAEDFFKIILS
jgi:hypothetical protein